MSIRLPRLMRTVIARLVQGGAMLLVLSFLLFGLMAHLPGDPVDLLVQSNPELRPEDVVRLKKLRGLDQPVHVRWWRWMVGHAVPLDPPRTITLPPVFGALQAISDDDDDGDNHTGRVRGMVVQLDLRSALKDIAQPKVAALPPAVLNGDTLEATILRAGATRLVLVSTDNDGQQAPIIIPVYVAPALPGVDDDALGHASGDTPIILDGEDSLTQGGTELPLTDSRTDWDLQTAAMAAGAPPAAIVTVDDDNAPPGQHVVTDGELRIMRGPPLTDPDRWTPGVVALLWGETEGLGWSWATKRPVAELLFGKESVCGDGIVDVGEDCDAGTLGHNGARGDDDGCTDCLFDDPASRVEWSMHAAHGLVRMGRIGNTLVLTVPALLLAMLISLFLGTWAGLRPGSVVDVVVRAVAALAGSVPAFVVALLLITVFAEMGQLLPSGGIFSPGIHELGLGETLYDRWRHLILPMVVLVLFWSGRFVRQVRSAVIAANDGAYVRTARMKGASPWRVVRVHLLPNAAIPLVTLVGLSLPTLFSGALLTETVFAWPGLGRLQYDAILQNDSYVAVVVFLFSAALVLLGSLFADVAVLLLDPRTDGGEP